MFDLQLGGRCGGGCWSTATCASIFAHRFFESKRNYQQYSEGTYSSISRSTSSETGRHFQHNTSCKLLSHWSIESLEGGLFFTALRRIVTNLPCFFLCRHEIGLMAIQGFYLFAVRSAFVLNLHVCKISLTGVVTPVSCILLSYKKLALLSIGLWMSGGIFLSDWIRERWTKRWYLLFFPMILGRFESFLVSILKLLLFLRCSLEMHVQQGHSEKR